MYDHLAGRDQSGGWVASVGQETAGVATPS